MINPVWTEINVDEFIASARSKENMIRVICSGNFSEHTKFRKSILGNDSHWKNITQNSFLPWYKDGKSWDDLSAKNFGLHEYTSVMPSEVLVKVREVMSNANNLTITTAYHPALNKRLIIDGVHRALGIELGLTKIDPSHEIKIIECYGDQINLTFDSDFRHLK